MAHIIVKRYFEQGLSRQGIAAMLDSSQGCLGDWGVEWVQSYQSLDTKTSVCHYEAADSDSVHFALRQIHPLLGYELWNVTNHLGDEELPINVLVERRFDSAADFKQLQAQEERNAWCLETHSVNFVKTYFAKDKKWMMCLYHAPDAEAVRMAQTKAKLPYTHLWPCKEWFPSDFGLT